jgi:oligopeptide transport system permease protein
VEAVKNLEQYGLTDEELFTVIEHDELESEKITAPRYSYWRSVFRVFFRKKINIFILIVMALLLIFTYIYPMLIDYDPFANISNAEMKHLAPGAAIEKMGFSLHSILGTGDAGQPTFDAIWNGARISVSLAFVCAAINMTLGILVGAVWGFSKKVDLVMTEVFNIIGNIPYILLISVLVMLFAPSFWTMVFALTVTGWLAIAYFIRTQVIIIRDREHNLASRCLGTPLIRIAFKNILPFMTSVIVTYAAAEIPSYISYEVFLSYIGMGLSDMSLGRMIEQAQNAMVTPGWGFEFWSPVAITAIITVSLYVMGQNLGDASDPRTHM